MDKKATAGHIMALITILIWGTTFISTKILLAGFTPIEILFFRFLLGLLVLIAVYPKRLRIKDKKQELTFAAAGLCGICLYYLLENIALTYTRASNVGVIISVAPFFTAVLSHVFLKTEEKLKAQFFIGFIIAMTGRIFTYGILFMLPFLFVFDFNLNVQKLVKPEYALNLIYLGLGASALCFVTWNYAVKVLGAVKTSVYIYIVPVITVVTSIIVLKEEITWMAAIGIGLTLIGLFLSESKPQFKKRGKRE